VKMMKDTNQPDRQLEEALRALEHLERATPPPFFYTRLVARIDREKQQAVWAPRWMVKPVFMWAALALMLSLNVLSAVRYAKNQERRQTERVQTVQQFVDEYSLAESQSFYLNDSYYE
jgi:hypothetical protein